jgi:hypothetical protein
MASSADFNCGSSGFIEVLADFGSGFSFSVERKNYLKSMQKIEKIFVCLPNREGPAGRARGVIRIFPGPAPAGNV